MSQRINDVQRSQLGVYERGVAVLLDQVVNFRTVTTIEQVETRLRGIVGNVRRIERGAITGEAVQS